MFPLVKAIPPTLSFFALLVGVLALAIGAMRSNDEGANLPSDFQKARIFGIVLLVILGIAVLIGSGIGIIGFFIKKYTFIWIFYIGVGISSAVLFILGLALLVSNASLADITKKEVCESTPQFKDWLTYEKRALIEFCSPSCPCADGRSSGDQRAIRFQDCPSSKSKIKNGSESIDAQGSFFNDVGVMENYFKCSGICAKLDLYMFSDVRRGRPSSACGEVIRSYIDDQGHTIGSTALGCAIGLIFLIALTCMSNRYVRKREAAESEGEGGFQRF